VTALFLDIVNLSISAGWLVLAVLALRFILKKAPKWVNVLPWGIVAVRLICPLSIESVLSLIPSTETISPEIMVDWMPEISTGIKALDQVVNPVIFTFFAPELSASTKPLQILIPVAANLWLFGVTAMLIYSGISCIILSRKLRTAVILRDNIFLCETVHSPFVLGILKPKIYLPYTLSDHDLGHVVAHEQAHIRRKDHLWKSMGFLLLTFHWFNPLMWIAYVLLCKDIELACDEKVIAELGNEQRGNYTQALVSCSVTKRMIATCPLAFGEVSVNERVKSIMNYRKPSFWIIVINLILCSVVAVCFLTNPVDPVDYLLQDYSTTVERELPDDLSLTIYYLSPSILTRTPLSSEALISYSLTETIIVESSELKKYQDLLQKMNESALEFDRTEPYVNARLYYVFSTEENNKLLEVVISERSRDPVVNGIHVKNKDTIYELIAPFLPEDVRNMFGI
jgi:beta-lactamase regulating signal transducer with metallopeptidase domain